MWLFLGIALSQFLIITSNRRALDSVQVEAEYGGTKTKGLDLP
jgi:hypothetical protein